MCVWLLVCTRMPSPATDATADLGAGSALVSTDVASRGASVSLAGKVMGDPGLGTMHVASSATQDNTYTVTLDRSNKRKIGVRLLDAPSATDGVLIGMVDPNEQAAKLSIQLNVHPLWPALFCWRIGGARRGVRCGCCCCSCYCFGGKWLCCICMYIYT